MGPFELSRRWIGWGVVAWIALGATPLLAEGPRITGSLVDTDGAPIASGEITFVPYRSTHARRLAVLEGEPEPDAVRSRSDAEGRFEIALPDAGMWLLRATATGHAEMVDRLVPILRDRQLLPIELPPAKPVTVRVVDGDGQPVAQALVTVNQEGGSRRDRTTRGRTHRSAWIAWQHGRTNDQGTLQLTVATDGKRVVRVTAPGGRLGRAEHETSSRVEVTLRGGTPRTVRVVDAKGTARAGTLLAIGSNMVPLVRVDDAGEAVVVWPREEAESFELVAMTADDHWARETLKPIAGDVASAGDVPPKPLVMSLEAPANIAGVVVSKDTADPIPGAIVWENADPSNHVRTDGRGRYQIALFDRPNQFIQAGAMGFFGDGLPLKPVNFARNDGPSLRLEPGYDLRGVVVDREDQPVADVRVSVEPLEGGWRNRSDGSAESAENGRFLIGPLRAGTPLRLTTRRSGYAKASLELPVVAAGDPAPEVRVELVAGQVGFGLVLDGDEKPVVGANVYLIPGLPPGATIQALYSTARRQPDHELSAADGGFSFADMGAGTYDLSVDAPGFAPVTVPGIEVLPNEPEIDLGTILMEPGAVVEGIVVDGEDRPLSNSEVRVHQMAGISSRSFAIQDFDRTKAMSGVDGRFRIGGLSPGLDAMVSVKREGFTDVMMTSVRVPSEETLRIVLEPAGSLSGIVVDNRGDAVEGAAVLFSRDHQGSVRHFPGGSPNPVTDVEGRFEAEAVGAGTWDLVVRATGFQVAERAGIEIRAGEAHPSLRIELVPGAALEGTVLGSDGQPLADATIQQVKSVDVRRSFSRHMITGGEAAGSNQDGTYRLDGLPTGLTTFSVQAPNHRKLVRDVEIRAGENRLDLRLESGASIEGQVVDGNGEAVAGAKVGATPLAARKMVSMMTRVQSDAQGAFEVGGLEDGQYTVTATRNGYASASTETPVRIAGESVQGVVLRLGTGATLSGTVLGLGPDDLGQVHVMVMSREGHGETMMAQLDFEGRYRVENIGAGEWTVMVMMGSSSGATEALKVAPGDAELNLDLDVSGRIETTGRVLLDANTPAVGYQVIIRNTSVGFAGGQSITDSQGGFRVDGLKPGPAELWVQSPAGARVHREPVDIAEGRDVTVTLAVLRAVSGRIVDAGEGAPIEGADVTVTRLDDDAFAFLGGSSGVGSDDNGVFRFEPMPPGRYRINAKRDGYGAASTTIDLNDADVAGIELRMAPSMGLTLFVRFTDGQAVGTVSIVALDAAEQVVMTGRYPAGENGRVQVSDLPAGRWTLMVSADFSVTTTIEVEAPGDPITVVIPDGGGLTVRMPSIVGEGQVGTMRLLDPRGRPYRTTGSGRFMDRWPVIAGEGRMPTVPVGTWTVEVTLTDGTVLTGAAAVVAGGRVDVPVQ